MVLNPTNLFGYTKYLTEPEPEPEPGQLWCSRIKLVFQMSDFRYEIKIELKLRYLLSDLKILTLKIRVRSYATNDTQLILFPVLVCSSVSDLGTGLGVILVLKRLDSAQLSCRDSLRSAPWDSQFQLDQLIETP
jgi:hypothetical protein